MESKNKRPRKQEEDEKMKEYVHQFVEYWENNITNVFTRKKDILADSVLEIFRSHNTLKTSTRRLYIMIREMSGSKTQHITRIVNTMKKYHQTLSQEYTNVGHIDTTSTGSFL